MTGSHSRLGISDRESRTTGVIRAYDTGTPDPPSIFLSPIFRNGRGAEGLGTRLVPRADKVLVTD